MEEGVTSVAAGQRARREKEGPRWHEQMAFEGLEVTGFEFQLRGTTGLEAKGEFAIGEVVSGSFEGMVAGVHFETEKKSGALVRRHVIEVREARIDE